MKIGLIFDRYSVVQAVDLFKNMQADDIDLFFVGQVELLCDANDDATIEKSVGRLINLSVKERCDCVIALTNSGNSFQIYANRIGFATVPIASIDAQCAADDVFGYEICSMIGTPSVLSVVDSIVRIIKR